jgi:acylphosphatase
VQGVSFRYYTRERAGQLGVTGWVRNEPDGSVAGHFEGRADAVDALVAWCREGPPAARVEAVAVSRTEPRGHGGFSAG